MKQYVIDELRPGEFETLKSYFDAHFGPEAPGSAMSCVYWIPLAEDLLTGEQKTHDDCKPFYFAVELEEKRLSSELLIRTKNRMQCACMGYATREQRDWIIQATDAVFEKLGIII